MCRVFWQSELRKRGGDPPPSLGRRESRKQRLPEVVLSRAGGRTVTQEREPEGRRSFGSSAGVWLGTTSGGEARSRKKLGCPSRERERR